MAKAVHSSDQCIPHKTYLHSYSKFMENLLKSMFKS